MKLFKLEQKDKTVRDLPEKFQQGFKVSYLELKKCVLKREAGIKEDTCDKIWKDLGISEV